MRVDLCSTPSTWTQTAAKEALVDSEAGWEGTLGQLSPECGTLIQHIQYLSAASFSCLTLRVRPCSPCCAGYPKDASQSVLETIRWHVIWPRTNYSEGSRSGMVDIHQSAMRISLACWGFRSRTALPASGFKTRQWRPPSIRYIWSAGVSSNSARRAARRSGSLLRPHGCTQLRCRSTRCRCQR